MNIVSQELKAKRKGFYLMNKSRLDLLHIKLQIASMATHGFTQRQIATEYNTSQPTISRMLKRKDVIDMVKESQARQIIQVQVVIDKIENNPAFLAELERVIAYNLMTLGGRLKPKGLKSSRINMDVFRQK